MEHVAPLIQTVLWVTLIGGIVWRFHKPIHGLLSALQKRVEAGSNIKAGPFELSEQLRPQALVEQVQKTETEVRELAQSEATEAPNQPQEPVAQVRSRFLEAEDLALRAVQLEYGKPVSRQVSLGPDMLVDGAFTINGELHIVEVKHFIRLKHAIPTVQRTLQTFASTIERYRWRRAKIVLAAVFHSGSDVPKAREELSAIAAKFSIPVEVRCYALEELRSQFGVA